MKRQHKRRFLEAYKWWDHSYLLQAMEDWLFNAAKKHATSPWQSVNSKSTIKHMKTCAALCKRIREDEYHMNTPLVWPKYSCDVVHEPLNNGCVQMKWVNKLPNEKTYERFSKKHWEHSNKMRKADLELLTKLLNKHLLTFWD